MAQLVECKTDKCKPIMLESERQAVEKERLGIKGLLVRDSLPGESLCCVLSKARHFISCCLSTGLTYEDRKSSQYDRKIVDCDIIKASK